MGKYGILALLEINSNKEKKYVAASKFLELQEENMQQKGELDDLRAQKTAVLSGPQLNVLGEDVGHFSVDCMATIDGATFYSEGLLNSFLDEPIRYQDGTIYYGKDKPARVNAISAGLYYDGLALDVYDEDFHFFMGNTEYSSGIVATAYISDTIRIACDGNYSYIEFWLGHVDNTKTVRGKLRVSYLENGKTIEAKAIELSDGTPKTKYRLPIYNTSTVTIELSAVATDFGLANIYLEE